MTRFTIATLTLIAFGATASACERCGPVLKSTNQPDAVFEAPPIAANDDDDAQKQKLMKKYEATAQKVWKNLVAHAKPLPGQFWAPQFLIVDDIRLNPKVTTRYNAVAWWVEHKERRVLLFGKPIPLIRITRGYLEIFEGNEHTIALVLGHELGHHALDHTDRWDKFVGKPKPEALLAAEGHRREADADLFGGRLMLKAGYSPRGRGVQVEGDGIERDALFRCEWKSAPCTPAPRIDWPDCLRSSTRARNNCGGACRHSRTV